MTKSIISIFTALILLNIFGAMVIISLNNLKVKKYNSEIARSISLSEGVGKLTLVNEQDVNKIKKAYAANLDTVSKDSVDITSYLKPFLEDLENSIILKYNYKYYRYEVTTELLKNLDIYSRYRFKQNEVDEISKLCMDIDELHYFAHRDMEVYEVLEKTYKLCEEYRLLSVEQRRGVYNDIKLAQLVEEFGGSLETNFNLELAIWKIKSSIDKTIGEYRGPTDESLGIVQGAKAYSNDGEEIENVKIQEDKYNIEEADFDDLGTFMQIPKEYYDCVVDMGSGNDNYIDEDKLLRHIANIDNSKLYVENARIYLIVTTNMEDIPLLNWGILSYYIPDNRYKDYVVKDYEYMNNGRFRVELMSTDKTDYRIVEGDIKENTIYFDNIEKNIPKFEKLHIDIISNRWKFET